MENLKQLGEQSRKQQYKPLADEIINIFWMIAAFLQQGTPAAIISHQHEYKHLFTIDSICIRQIR